MLDLNSLNFDFVFQLLFCLAGFFIGLFVYGVCSLEMHWNRGGLIGNSVGLILLFDA